MRQSSTGEHTARPAGGQTAAVEGGHPVVLCGPLARTAWLAEELAQGQQVRVLGVAASWAGARRLLRAGRPAPLLVCDTDAYAGDGSDTNDADDGIAVAERAAGEGHQVILISPGPLGERLSRAIRSGAVALLEVGPTPPTRNDIGDLERAIVLWRTAAAPPRGSAAVREAVVTARLDPATLAGVELLVRGGLQPSRSAAVAWLARMGAEAQAPLLAEAARLLAQRASVDDQLRALTGGVGTDTSGAPGVEATAAPAGD